MGRARKSDKRKRVAIVLGGMYLAGKGSNSELAVAKFRRLKAVSSGDILRSYAEAKKYTDKGKNVPDRIFYPAIGHVLRSCEECEILLADGWVRKLSQVQKIKELLMAAGFDRIVFVDFQVVDDACLESRRKQRWLKKRRPDDKYDIAWRRIRSYRRRAKRMLNACRESGYEVHVIDASPPLPEVFQKFCQVIEA